jgi:uncharacterized protein
MKGPISKILAAGAFALLAVLPAPAPVYAEVQVPFLSGRIVDLADMLSPGAEQRLEVELEAIESTNGAQLAILTVPTLEGEAIESFALRVVEAWKLGQKKQDNGALLLIARDDRKMRIEVGYGLEGAIPDVIAKRILAERLTPRFQAGDFDGGITDAVNTLGGIIRGEPGALPEKKRGRGGFNPVSVLFVIAIVLSSLIWPAIHSKKFNWTLYTILALPSFLLPKMIAGALWGFAGLGAWLVIFPLLRLIAPHLPAPSPVSSSRGGGGWWIGGGGGRSGGGGWSSGGGGFSGGGGSFGGGGASGSW